MGPSATEDEIVKSYRNLAKLYHPDRNPDGVEKFQEITEAFKVLSDSDKRKIYDDKGETGLMVQKSTESGCCKSFEDPNSGQLQSYCYGSMCETYEGDEDESDDSETDEEEDLEEEDEGEDEGEDEEVEDEEVEDEEVEDEEDEDDEDQEKEEVSDQQLVSSKKVAPSQEPLKNQALKRKLVAPVM